MDFSDQLAALASRLPKQLEHLKTEAATSTALVMPFIGALGYNVFDPTEVVPEFTADVGIKKGEKVDYAIMRDSAPAILFEVKCWNVDLGTVHASQLYRYYSVTAARFGVLTNGVQYRFFTDLEEPNKMDEKAFLEFDIRELKPAVLEALKQFTRTRFNVDALLSAAVELKYTQGIVRAIAAEYHSPSEEFARHFARTVYSGNVTKAVREQFQDIVKRAFTQFVNDRLHERLTTALSKEDGDSPEKEADKAPEEAPLPEGIVFQDGNIITTQEEVDGFNIVRAILASVVDPARIHMRDTQSYCGVLFDNNKRKPVCRLRFNGSRKFLGIIDHEKNEQKVPLTALTDIYRYSDQLRSVLAFYQQGESGGSAES